MARDYNDVFEDLMRYVTIRLDETGNKLLVKNPGDLRVLIRRLDERRRGGRPRISERLIDEVLSTRAARDKIGKTVGHFGKTTVLSRRGTITKRYKQTLKDGSTRILVRTYDTKTGKVLREEKR